MRFDAIAVVCHDRAVDGIIKKTVSLCSAVRRGDRVVPGPCHVVTAVFDTGAAKSVLHPRVAALPAFPRSGLEAVRGAGGRVRLHTTSAYVQAPGCPRIFLAPWIDKDLPEALGADVIVGDDYMQAAYMFATPAERPPDARCGAAP